MVTQETLQYLREYREKPHFKGIPKPMFIDGEFSSANLFGGDDLIRIFFVQDFGVNRTEYHNKINILHQGTMEYMRVLITHNQCQDMNYATIVMDGDGRDSSDSLMGSYTDVAHFNWYGNHGHIRAASFNGNKITEDQYIRLLNIIEETGYKIKVQ